MYYTQLVLYYYISSVLSIGTSFASKHEIPAHTTITLKEHLRQVGQQLKKLPVTELACHVSLKNYSNEEFETALDNFKRKCIIHSLEQENKRATTQELEGVKNILELLYTCFTTKVIQPNQYVQINQKNALVAEFHYAGLHNFTESIRVLDYYNTLVQLLNLYRYFPTSYITTHVYTKIAAIDEDLASVVSAHLMEHIRHNLYCFFALLGCLSKQHYYFNDNIIYKLAQLLQEYKKLAFFCYTLEKTTLPDSNSALSSINKKPLFKIYTNLTK